MLRSLQQDHLPAQGSSADREGVGVDSARCGLTILPSAIPHNLVNATGEVNSLSQLSKLLPGDVINHQSNGARLFQTERDFRTRVEGVREILIQG